MNDRTVFVAPRATRWFFAACAVINWGLPLALIVALVAGWHLRAFIIIAGAVFVIWRIYASLGLSVEFNNDEITFRNLWRSGTIQIADVYQIRRVAPWWFIFVRGVFGYNGAIGVVVRGRRLGIPFLATAGMTIKGTPLEQLLILIEGGVYPRDVWGNRLDGEEGGFR